MMLAGEHRREALAQLATQLGYEADMVRWEFPVWVASRVAQADMVAFGRPQPEPQDQTTSALVGFDMQAHVAVDDAFEIAGALAAPAAALADEQGIDLWSVGASGHSCARQGQSRAGCDHEDLQDPGGSDGRTDGQRQGDR